jgi:hypothetical protein
MGSRGAGGSVGMLKQRTITSDPAPDWWPIPRTAGTGPGDGLAESRATQETRG